MAAALAWNERDDLGNQTGELCAGAKRFGLACFNDRLRNTLGITLFTELFEDASEVLLGVGIDNLCGGLASGCIHPHV